MDRSTVISFLESSKSFLAVKYGIAKIGLFGSFASQSHNSKSDIDLVFELLPGRHIKLKQRIELEEHFSKQLENRTIELLNRKYLNPVIRKAIENQIIYV